MCDPVTLGLVLTAAGTGAQTVNNLVSLRRQDEAAARGIRRQSNIQREANDRLADQIDELAASDGSAERAESLAGFQNALRASQESTEGALPGDASLIAANPRFAERVSQGREQISGGAADSAARLATITGASNQRLREGGEFARTATDLGGLRRQSQAEDFITQLQIAKRRPNEFVNALGSILQGAGSTIAMGGQLPGILKRGPNLGKLAEAGTIIDTPGGTNPFVAALQRGTMVS